MLEELAPPGVKAALRLVLAAGLFVLLIACANVANFMLARAIARRRDDALRLALGAGRAQLLRQSLAETLLVSLAGAVLGLAMAWAGAVHMLGDTPVKPPFWVQADLDWRTLAFTLSLALGSAVVVSLLPLWRVGRADLNHELKEGARPVAGGSRGRLGQALVVAELGLSLVLLSCDPHGPQLRRPLASDPGIDTSRVLTARVALAGEAYASPEARALFVEELVRRVREQPGVEQVGVSNGLPFPDPLEGGAGSRAFEVEGSP